MRTVFRLRPILRYNPLFRYVDLAMSLYDTLSMMDNAGYNGRGWYWGEYFPYPGYDVCSGGGGPMDNGTSANACDWRIPVPRTSGPGLSSSYYVWGPYIQDYLDGHPYAIYQPGFWVRRDPYNPPRGDPAGYRPVFMGAPAPLPIPHRLAQTRPNTNLRHAGNGPPQRPQTPTHRREPPRRHEREIKARVTGPMAAALRIAHGVTEMNDMIDALFSALPKTVQDATPRTGRLRQGARLGEGTRYLTPWDQGQAVFRNAGSLNLPAAAIALLRNHLTDMVVGRMHAGADRRSNRNLGGARPLTF